MYARGVIRNRVLANQVRDFRKLLWYDITPTDVDGYIDFANLAFVFIELKHTGTEMPYGQRLALERLGDRTQTYNSHSIVIVADHDTSDDIDVAECYVSLYRENREWKESKDIKVKPFIDSWLCSIGLSRYVLRADEGF